MRTSEKFLNKLTYLSSICDDSLPFKTKFAIISIMKESSPVIIDKLLLFIEYAQLLSQSLILHFECLENKNLSQFSEAVFRVAKIFSPGFLLSSGGTESFQRGVIISAFILSILKSILFLSAMFLCTRKDWRNQKGLIALWKWVVKLQRPFLYYFITSFCFNDILSHSTRTNSSEFQTLFKILSIGIITSELSSSLHSNLAFTYILPTSSFLSSKGCKIQMLTLIQKFVLQIIEVSIINKTQTTAWITASIQLLFCFLRDIYFYLELPLYKIKATLLQAKLLALVTCLNIMYFVQTLFRVNYDPNLSMDFTIITWIILIFLSFKIVTVVLENIFTKMITTNFCKNLSSKMLVHKIYAIKEVLEQNELPNKLSKNYPFSHLLNSSLNKNYKSVFNVEDASFDSLTEPNSYESFNKLAITYLENALTRRPKDNFLRLHVGFFYGKHLKVHALSMRSLCELNHSSFNILLTAELLREDLQSELIKNCKDGLGTIDLYAYSLNISSFAKLKLQMIFQGENQEKLYSEFSSERPNYENILVYSNTIHSQRKEIASFINTFLKQIPEYFLNPLIVCAYYHLELNHCSEGFMKLVKIYWRKQKKYEKYLN